MINYFINNWLSFIECFSFFLIGLLRISFIDLIYDKWIYFIFTIDSLNTNDFFIDMPKILPM